MTKEQQLISRKNNTIARQYYEILNKPEFVLHHTDSSLKQNNIDRYIQWNIEDVVVMTRSEHSSLHHKGAKRPEETCKKISESKKGIRTSEGMTGHHHSEETKNHLSSIKKGISLPFMSAVHKGTHWYTNGIVSIQAFECPEGYKPGRILDKKERY